METCSTRPQAHSDAESGFLLIALVGTLIPLILVVAAASMALSGNNRRLLDEINQEKALVAAESGIDEAIYRASTAIGLATGVNFDRTLAPGLSFTVVPVLLSTDLVDNDLDGDVDEADENVFQVTVTGRFRNTVRRLVAYLGPASSAMTAESSLLMQSTKTALAVTKKGGISGNDTMMDGSPGSPSNNLYGLAIDPPGTKADLSSKLSGDEAARVTGKGPAPSLAVASGTFDIDATVLAVQNTANIVLTKGEYSGFNFGNGAVGDFNVIYRNGSVVFKGGSQGAGIMVITGSLHSEGTVRFDGIVIVLGDVEIHGDTMIYGAMITGPNCPHINMEGTTSVIFSAEAVAGASGMSPGKYTILNGWQEISRK